VARRERLSLQTLRLDVGRVVSRARANPPPLQVGDTVRYAHAWLVSVGGWAIGHRTGTVIASEPARPGGPGQVVRVEWHDADGHHVSTVLACNLVARQRLHLEPF
jgi:hypothetical protein